MRRAALVSGWTGVVIAYGARCTWWDSKDKAGTRGSGLPCCPHCSGVLFETDEKSWVDGVAERGESFASQLGVDDYGEFLKFTRGECFGPSHFDAAEAYRARTR